jgi:hypothetical protein
MGEVNDAINDLGLKIVSPGEVLFLTGAGISAPDPTKFPLGNELHTLFLQEFTPLSATEISNVVNKLPFEATCQSLLGTFSGHSSSQFVNIFWNLVSELFTWRAENNWKV